MRCECCRTKEATHRLKPTDGYFELPSCVRYLCEICLSFRELKHRFEPMENESIPQCGYCKKQKAIYERRSTVFDFSNPLYVQYVCGACFDSTHMESGGFRPISKEETPKPIIKDDVLESASVTLHQSKKDCEERIKAILPGIDFETHFPLNFYLDQISKAPLIIVTEEQTHSCKLKFNNGDIVEIPPPEGEDWVEEIIYDEWTERREGQRKTKAYDYIDGFLDISITQLGIDEADEDYCAHLNHEVAKMLAAEYRVRISDEEPEVISLSKWTQTATIEEGE